MPERRRQRRWNPEISLPLRNLLPMSGFIRIMEAVVSLERDAELMLRVRDGDTASFALLLERHRGPVIQFMYRMVQNRAVAEELAQEAFFRVYRSRTTYEPTAKFTTWLFRISTHLALNWIRDQKSEKGKESLDQDAAGWRRPAGLGSLPYCGAAAGGRSQAAGNSVVRSTAAAKAARGRVDAQIRRNGLYPNRSGLGLLGIRDKIVAVSGV